MKPRIFYVVNLDRQRLFLLGTLFIGFMVFAFATGYRLGDNTRPAFSPDRSGSSLLTPLESPDALNSETGSPANQEEPTDSDTATDPRGESIYERSSSERRTPVSVAPPARDSEPARRPSSGSSTERSTASRSSSPNRSVATSNRSASRPSSSSTRSASSTTSTRTTSSVASAAPRTAPAARDPRSALLTSPETRLRNTATSPEPTPQLATAAATTEQTVEPAATTPAESPRSERTYSLQIAAFSSRPPAERLVASLRRQGFEPTILERSGRFLVRVGSAGSQRELWPLEAKLREQNYSPLTVSR